MKLLALILSVVATYCVNAQCNAPTGLSTSGITTSSSIANWNPVSGAISYDVDYQASSWGFWINIASGTTSTSWDLLGMPASTTFNWRVRANCSSGSSSYSQSQFTTLSSSSCNAPSGLSTLNITTSSATASWSPVSGATSYNVDYKASTSGSWINIAAGTTSTSWTLSGMPASTSFDWRVSANCSSTISGYSQTTFNTSSQTGTCSAPTGLSTSPITATAATARWQAVSGASSYNVEYKPASSSSWVAFGFGTSGLQWTLSGLDATTSYDWRVRANCTSGTSSYAQTQFTTQAVGSCSAPGGLSASNIASSTATLNWSPVSGAISYSVEYKPTSSGAWLYATSGTSGTSVNLYSLSANTTYDWRVVSNCSLSETSTYSFAQFTSSGSGSTPPPPSAGCPGPYDVSTNGTISGAAAISLNTDVKGTIAPKYDIDHYQFTISSGGTINVWLTTLPGNYDLAILNSSGTQIGISKNKGTRNESISLSVAAGTYYAKVYPAGTANSATSCYTLKVQTITATKAITTATNVTATVTMENVNPNFTMNLFPNPTADQLNVSVGGLDKKTVIKVYNLMGKLVMQQESGNTLTQLNVSKLSAGFYLVHVSNGKETRSAKFVKN